MSKLVFDAVGSRVYESGVRNCVLYPRASTTTAFTEGSTAYSTGVAWNGITGITESPSGAEANPFYADDIKYLNLISKEDFGGTIECYTYPDEWEACDGKAELADGVVISQQARQVFGLCYKTMIGDDVNGDEHGYKLHLVYGATAAPSEESRTSMNESPEPMTMSYEFSTVPVDVTGYRPIAHLVINSLTANATKLATLLEALYGKDGSGEPVTGAIVPHLPMPDVIKTMMTVEE